MTAEEQAAVQSATVDPSKIIRIPITKKIKGLFDKIAETKKKLNEEFASQNTKEAELVTMALELNNIDSENGVDAIKISEDGTAFVVTLKTSPIAPVVTPLPEPTFESVVTSIIEEPLWK